MILMEATGAFPDLPARYPTHAAHDKLHDLMATRDYHDALPAIVRDHLVCRVVDRLIPVTQKQDIEGLVMGVA
jgi:hypothetical protein